MESSNANIPFIHLMHSRYGYYFFDVNTNEIVKITKNTYEHLNNVLNGITEWSEKTTESEITYLIEKGYLSNHRPHSIEVSGLDNIDYYLKHNLRILILQITQKCNFRCRYCHFSSDEFGYHNHNLASMNWDTAKKAIDFFGARTRDTNDISVVFYGGEPLIERVLLYRCIDYCNEVFEGKKLSYYLTTNGELLDVQYAKDLIDNNVNITVSLDGPKEIQDRNRKRAYDGSGSFDTVYKNLTEINQKLPDYFSKISFNSVLDPSVDCQSINQFFSDALFNGVVVKANLMSPNDGKKLSFSENYLNTDKRNKLLFMLTRANLLDESQIPILSRNHFSEFYEFESKYRNIGKLSNRIGHTGPCKPGYNKLFVSVDGRFLICEKVRDNSQSLCIGSLEQGFDIPKIKEVCNFMCRDKCKNCWNIQNCNVCQMMVDDGKKLSVDLFDTACINSRRKAEDNFKIMIALSEVGEMLNLNEKNPIIATPFSSYGKDGSYI